MQMATTRGYGLLEGLLSRWRGHRARQSLPAALRSGRLLDLGCGPHPLFLLSCGFAETYGLDKSLPAVAAAGATAWPCLQPYNLEPFIPLPFPDGHFAAVTMLAVIEHLDATTSEALLADIYRVLQPGGMAVLTTPAAWADRLLRLMARARLLSPVEISDHKQIFTPARLRQQLQTAGFAADNISVSSFQGGANLLATASR
jgi:SAM-dependent methyltransferase